MTAEAEAQVVRSHNVHLEGFLSMVASGQAVTAFVGFHEATHHTRY
jgi:hypothetical protein